ncbi:putative transmembrane protease serine 9 [Apostichopus japonicus]|uniref:Putative transmembrane protease serine 9 n=1 Tax=Stichopus japonicus TaxID=307972 RepID=A0A2G8JPT5_STIJA|nr:putative transmembrane protease serine 9 [Apostichopus japonicus]
MKRRRLFAARNEWPCVCALLLIFISPGPIDGKADCGVPSVSFLSHLVDLTPETWPWIGSLRNNVNEHICTAVLISSNTAVSTASCFDYENLVEFLALPAVAIFGSADKRLVYASYQHASTFDVTLHPGHNMYAGLEHDIAILQLHKPVEEFTSYVSPICVNSQEKEDEVFTHCKLAGWGWADDLIMPDDLQSTSVSITSHNICVNIYGVFDKQSFLCVEPSSKICSATSGRTEVRLYLGTCVNPVIVPSPPVA